MIPLDRFYSCVEESASWLKKKCSVSPKVIVVLSAGLDPFLDNLKNTQVFSVSDIPHFPTSRAAGHVGKLVFGTLEKIPLVVLHGRQHYYEGHSPQEVVFPYFVLNALGAATLITTNSVGGIRHDLNAGDILLVTDHINFMGANPLIGIAVQRKENQFTSMTDAYHHGHRDAAKKVAASLGIELKEGVLVGVSGPNYETPAEIRMLRTLGADAVGMSTVFEVIAANFLGMKVVTFSIIANPAADRHEGAMRHDEVVAAMQMTAPKVVSLLNGVLSS